MNIKLLVALLVVGACVLQVTCAPTEIDEFERGIIDDLIKKAKEAARKLVKYIKEKVKSVLNLFDELKEKASDLANSALDSFKSKLNSIIASANKQIDEIKKKAEELGIDVSGCIKKSKENIKSLFKKLLDDEIQCIQNEIDKILKIISESTDVLDDSIKVVQNVPEKLKKCGSSLKCIKDVIWETARLQINIPNKIKDKVFDVTTLVSTLPGRLQVCATTELVEAASDATSIVGDVAKCAADLE